MRKNIGTKFLEREGGRERGGEREREREIIKRQHALLRFLPAKSLRRVRGGGGEWEVREPLNLSIPSLRLNIAYIMIPVGGVKVLNIPALNVACIMDSFFLGVHSGRQVVRTVTRLQHYGVTSFARHKPSDP